MQPLMNALAWAFAHSLWEGFFAALLTAVIISATRKTKAGLRYNLLAMVFVLFLIAVSLTFIIQLQGTVSSPLVDTAAGSEVVNPIVNNLPEALSGGVIADLTAWFNNNTGLFLLAWALFFIVNCVKLFAGLSAVDRLRRYKTHPVNEEWNIKLQQLQDILGIRQSVILLQSELIKVPVVLGFLKPVILLPVGLITSIPPEQAEAILLHELGHIRRKDYLVNFLQRFAEAIFFFNPAVLWISSLLRQEREACCDDIVVDRIGQKRNYLNALVSFQEYAIAHNPYAVGICSRRQYLLNRVKRIVTNENKKLNLIEKAALLSGVLLFSAFTYIAQEKEVALPVTTSVERLSGLQPSNGSLAEKVPVGPQIQLTRKGKKKARRTNKPITDTIPIKGDKTTWLNSNPDQKPLPSEQGSKKAATDADRVLEEIQQIKNRIGAKKESIGMKKEKLKEQQGKDTKEEQALKIQIEKERGEIEGQRAELERKRSELEQIKKQNEKIKQQQNEIKNEWKTRKANEWENRKASEWENRKGNEFKNEKKNEIKTEIKNEDKNEKKHEKEERDEEKSAESKRITQKRTITKLRDIHDDKVRVAKDARLFASHKPSLFKLNSVKYKMQERQFKLEQKETETPKPPVMKENLKSPEPPKMKTLPGS